ncbi:histone-lysine N-methyltransferase, H3 lysine-9 specific SUVH4 [Cicer arietinum]|uniref:Histone-lysine N-methyltransferase, H3 lysine-9 specific SUVH4 n=1 Tax=Cicer arietinum TaxID=3827 RepID=A0A1S3E294_CICAR|nr:histone-lysine N-methyltransferase, H3 lysine-9 specific SUVH4 [Cicer arietinum]XP_012569186.1 histone-lysine N-methyltransferase, H3 lysine-9 specific SUVH4 [Cicer arietinum]
MVSEKSEMSPKLKITVKYGGKETESKDTPMQQRRSSARIQAKQKEVEEIKLRRIAEVVEEKEKSGEVVTAKSNKRKKINDEESVVKEEVVSEQQKKKKKSHCEESLVKEEDVSEQQKKKKTNGEESVVKEEVVSEQQKKKKKSPATARRELMEVRNEEITVGSENAVGALGDKSLTAKVKDTIRVFNKHYLHLIKDEEERCAKAKAESEKKKKAGKKVSKAEAEKKKTGKKDSAKKDIQPNDSKHAAKRPDLKALTKMMQNNEILYPEKRIGNIPGIEVGYQFYSRAEMVAVGFHSHWLNGIDFIGQSYSKVYSCYELPVAVAIVLSGMYEDDLDNAEDVVYTGQGGHNLTGDKRQMGDQKMERGNLALKNCAEQCVPVRVVRGHESSSSYTRKVYTYDGLYKVVNYWAEKGISGFTVYKFRLRRVEGQPTLTTNQVYFTCGRVPQSVAEIRGLVCEDISGGQEDVPIPATNLVDDPPVPPTGFKYCKSLKVAKSVKLPVNAPGCKCKGICNDPTTCECAKRNGSEFPYVSKDGGRLVEAKDVVFECGPNCGCDDRCVNRTSQKGLRYRLEVFRTAKKGWAVRSWDFIPSGAPVCEYTGILARTEDMDSVLENNYIFEIDCLQTIKGLGGRERRSQNVPFAVNLLDKYDDQGSESAPEFCIDAGSTGNIARFINHCCEPNLFVQCVLSTHHDLRLARVMLFAADNIPPLQELTYDYGYELDSVLDSDGKIKQMPCYCGATGCRKRLF